MKRWQDVKKINNRFLSRIRNLTMENLGQINIIIGENNSGKTSILEAIQLFDYA